jgi:hypothetical protein
MLLIGRGRCRDIGTKGDGTSQCMMEEGARAVRQARRGWGRGSSQRCGFCAFRRKL